MHSRLHIIIADGDPACCQGYRDLLGRLGHEVVIAGTLSQLTEQCRQLSPDLVIAEIKPADREGIAALQALCREQPIPIVVATDVLDSESARSVAAIPCVLGYLSKPVRGSDLEGAIHVARARFEQLRTSVKETADLKQALEERKTIERAKGALMRYLGIDEQDAFGRLRKLACDQNRKLFEASQRICQAADVLREVERLASFKTNGHDGNGAASAERNRRPARISSVLSRPSSDADPLEA